MAVVLRLSDVIDITYIAPEKTIVLTTKTIIYEIVVNNEESGRAIMQYIDKALQKDPVIKKEPKLPRFYSQSQGGGT